MESPDFFQEHVVRMPEAYNYKFDNIVRDPSKTSESEGRPKL